MQLNATLAAIEGWTGWVFRVNAILCILYSSSRRLFYAGTALMKLEERKHYSLLAKIDDQRIIDITEGGVPRLAALSGSTRPPPGRAFHAAISSGKRAELAKQEYQKILKSRQTRL